MVNLDWVKDYIDISDQDLKELAVKITKAGINIEKVISSRIDNLVIGEVIECVNHPDSDHLHVCKINVGENVLQIVCGAPNIKAGIKVVVALVGAKLSGGEIKKGKIRGVDSDGMVCALCELGLEEDNEENYKKGIYIVDNNIKVGEDANIVLGNNDVLYELDIHKHRNNDCYYHIGFAYEIASILNRKIKLPDIKYDEISEKTSNYVNLKVDSNNCNYYLGKVVKDVVIKDSPEFIKKRLNSVGIRSINNVVDISNYVMLEFGQPLHFFDLDKLGNNVVVRDAKDNEEIITLDGINRTLTSRDIVITDGNKSVCIAGVMGGQNTEVDNNTKNIFVEAAIFNPVSIRYTSQKLNLRSEASIRYGKGLSYEYTNMAMDRACYLLSKYADATILSGLVKHDNVDKCEKHVLFEVNEINTILGMNLNSNDVKNELDRLDFKYLSNGDNFDVIIPSRRLDIDPNVNDIAEEIGRLYGYHNLVSTLPSVETRRGVFVGDVKLRKDISKYLRKLGLNECKTYTLTSPDMVKMFKYEDRENIYLPNPMSLDKSVIRTSIIPSLYNIYLYNKARKIDDILIYEISKTYDVNYIEDVKVSMLISGNYLTNSFNHNNIKCDFYVLKGIVEKLFKYLGFNNRYEFVRETYNDIHPGISAKILLDREEIGIIGKVHPSINKNDIYVCEISMSKMYNKSIKALKYKESSKYPTIIKDVAFIIDKDVDSSELEKVIKKSGGKLLNNICVFDVYTGDNIDSDKKSIAYNLTFGDSNRTLTEEEVMNVFNNIILDVSSKCNAVLRDK